MLARLFLGERERLRLGLLGCSRLFPELGSPAGLGGRQSSSGGVRGLLACPGLLGLPGESEWGGGLLGE